MFRPRPRHRLPTFLGLALLLLLSGSAARAQLRFEPATSGFSAEIRVWTSGGNTYAKVRLTFPNTGYRVSDWGQPTRSGNQFTVNAKVERCVCISGQAITFQENTYALGALEPGTYTFTFKSYGTAIASTQFDPAQVVERWEPATLPGDRVGVQVWTHSDGLNYTRISLYFPDTGHAVLDWGQVVRSGNEFSIDVKAERWTGESQARTNIVDRTFQLGALSPGSYTIVVKMYGATVKTVPFNVSAAPKLLTEENSQRAAALDSVTWMRLFPLVATHNFSSDRRTRVMLFAADVALQPGETLTAWAEDAQLRVYPLAVEYVGRVPGQDWLTQIVVRPLDELKEGGDFYVTIGLRGLQSNKALIHIRPSGSQ